MATVVLPPAQVEAVSQVRLVSVAVHVIQQNGAASVAKVAGQFGFDGSATAELLADHLGVEHVPVVIAHRPPGVVVEHLHPAVAAAVPIHHTDRAPCW